MSSVVVHYKELSLKGRNRPWFIQMLVRNIKTALKGLHVASVRSLTGRIEIDLTDQDADEIRARLRRVFGIANFAFARRGPHDFDALAAMILEDLTGYADVASFRVSATRSDKRLPFTSPVVEREVGGRIRDAKGWRVDLDDPALTIRIEMLAEGALYYFVRDAGAGGLPTGTGGRVACLLSGGIDSPVAAYRVMRRGCSVLFVHFHSYPILSRASQEKVREIATLLTKYQLQSRLVLIPFGDVQQKVVLAVASELRVVIYRRLMLRIAERIARRWHARALVTGDVIGQVASQTLENMTTIASATEMTILRPLIGMDKDEITGEAERIGTFPISIIPDQDCCTLFTPKHPATRARPQDVMAAEQSLAIDELIAAAVASAEVVDYKFPMLGSPWQNRHGLRGTETPSG